MNAPPPQKTTTVPPVVPPVRSQAPPAATPHQEQPSSATTIAKPVPAPPSTESPAVSPPAAVSVTPAFGRLIWTGRLQKSGTVIIDGASVSTGSLSGELPGKPVRFSVWPGDLTNDGIVLYTANLQGASRALESAGPQNGWNKTVYMFNPHRASDITVVELPASNNAWKRLVLRSKNPRISVIVVEWALIQ